MTKTIDMTVEYDDHFGFSLINYTTFYRFIYQIDCSNLSINQFIKFRKAFFIIYISFLPLQQIPFRQLQSINLLSRSFSNTLNRHKLKMIHTAKDPSNIKKLNYLLHKHARSQEYNIKLKDPFRPQENQHDCSLTKSTTFPIISPNNRHNNIYTQNHRLNSTVIISQTKQNEYHQSINTKTSGKDYTAMNTSILKMIQEKIYPMNKEVTQKIKLRNNLSCETLRQGKHDVMDSSIVGDRKSIQKLNRKSKKKQQVQTNQPGDISDERLGLTNREKRTKSQEEIIRLQAKVQSYLRDRKKLLKVKYDQQMENIVQSSLNTSKVAQSIKQQAKLRTIKRLITQHNSNKQSPKREVFANNSFLIEKQCQLKRVIKLFQQRGNNFTCLDSSRQKVTRFEQIEHTEQRKDNLKELTGVSSKDLSQSLKLISNMVNRKLEEVRDITDANLKALNHQEIIQRTQRQNSTKMLQVGNNIGTKKKILPHNQENSKLKSLKKQQSFKLKKEYSNKKLPHQQKVQKQVKKQVQPTPLKKSALNSQEMRHTDKLNTQYSVQQIKSNDKQNITPVQQATIKLDKKQPRSFKIIPQKYEKKLDKQLLGQIQQELLDQKRNLLKKKMNEKKLIKKRKDSCIMGLSIL